MNRTPRHIFLIALLLLIGSSAMAQNDPQYVIKRRTDAGSTGDHYLEHVKEGNNWMLRDATSFNPNCVWYSGNTVDQAGVNHNYYFIEETASGQIYHFLRAPLEGGGQISVSDSIPSTQLLRNKEQMYYFYDWDWDNKPVDGGGIARGYKHTGLTQGECEAHTNPTYSWGAGECWEVYWLEYNNISWKLTDASHYTLNQTATDPVPNAARFRYVSVTPHPINVTGVTSGELDPLADVTLETLNQTQVLSVTSGSNVPGTYSYSCIPAYTTYVFENGTHNYFNNGDQGENTPEGTSGSGTPSSYKWVVSGQAAQYLSFSSGSHLTESTDASPTLRYYSLNSNGHATATLTVTVTYTSGITQVRTATVTVKTPCSNPLPLADPVVVYDHVTVSWVNTADAYTLSWKKSSKPNWSSTTVTGTNTYTFDTLAYDTDYDYKVKVACDANEPEVYHFKTKKEPELLIYGSVFGGGRVADVEGHTEVVIINCDSIGAVYGGNDIAGSVLDVEGSSVILGIDASEDSESYAHLYNGNQGSTKVRVNDVYGGGNGYYAYNGSTFTAASSNYTSQSVAPGGQVRAMTPTGQVGEVVWTNTTTNNITLNFPEIVITNITLTNDAVKVDSVFGGAKNAFVTHVLGTTPTTTWATNGSTINIDGGTALAVYGGNNIGGNQGRGKHKIQVNQTTTNIQGSLVNTATTGFGRDFGIRYLFGGGNKVAGSTTDVYIMGGQLDTIFGGGNEADVYAANVTVNCELGEKDTENNYIYGKTYTKAIIPDEYATTGVIGKTTIDTVNYPWDGYTGVYNVRTLFGGGNQAAMSGVPNVNLLSGSVGTVYGGGNAGDMLADATDNSFVDDGGDPIKFSTHVVMNSSNILVDYLYGGCQVSNVDWSTWVEIKNGHVGHVYGGCNVSGDVGSTRLNTELEPINLDDPTLTPAQKRAYFLEYQKVQGSTYVQATGGIIYKRLFAGGNGYYHCNDGFCYTTTPAVAYGDPEGKYIGLPIPTHNETHVTVSSATKVRGNVYAGGNMAPVGFDGRLVGNSEIGFKPFPQYVGYASVRMNGGTVMGDVYGGGNMAAIYGSNEVQVSGGKIGGALYGGNDKLGTVANMTSRALPEQYFLASDLHTPLTDVATYISLTGRPDINTVYGGGNGDYDYTTGDYCDPENLPIQSDIFVDINIDGFPLDENTQGGHINTVYGGGNGVTITGKTTVFLNVNGEGGGKPVAYDHVGTIFGGNNKGHLTILPDIILLKGQVNTVYGGCNQGAMVGDNTVTGGDATVYQHVGSVVRLRNEYTVTNTVASTPVTTTTVPTAKVSGAVYGGCRMNGVNNNSLVLVEGGNHNTARIFGGSDISGDIGGTSRVVVINGTHNDPNNATVVGDVFGGGNGDYDYNSGDYAGLEAPYSVNSLVEMKSGTAANLFAGGYSGPCGGTTMQVDGGTVTGKVFGGGNMAGTVTSHSLTTTTVDEYGTATVNHGTSTTSGTSTVNMTGGTVRTGIYGGCNTSGDIASDVTVNINQGTVGASGAGNEANIHGGGYGQSTTTSANVEVNIGTIDAASASATPTIYGAIYGGSALGSVNNVSASPLNTTTVNFLNGTLVGNVYGGGLGDKADLGEGHANVEAKVYGTVEVNVSNNTQTAERCFIDLRQANIFGCNNTNGSPQDDVTVNVYKTAYNFSDYATGNKYKSSYIATGSETPCYTIRQVFGGGNQANYAPLDTENKTTVNVYGCNNTIGRTFGGGNAADAYAVVSNIQGGRFHQVFGGGNGDPTAANIGAGGATLNVYGGNIIQLFGCNNLNGEVNGPLHVNVTNTTNCPDCPQDIAELFGGSNQAVMGTTTPVSLTTTIECSNPPVKVGDIYGGSNLADITGDVTLVIKGGTFTDVFAGSKGRLADSGNGIEAKAANIKDNGENTGNVTLNLYGGQITNAFGGSNINGNIEGNIVVNVLDLEASNCGLDITNIYGASNQTAYTPNNESAVSPVVNVIHIAQADGIRGNVYGGGNLAGVTANPKVNIGYDATTMYQYIPKDADDNPIYTLPETPRAYVTGNVYGGGNKAGVTGNPVVNMNNGTVVSGIYGGCNTSGIIAGDINVNIYNGTLGTSSVDMTEGIFGGGKGQATQTTGDVTVTIGDGTTPNIYADVYGGSALGQVGAAGKTAKVDLKNGTVNGKVFGGGEGDDTNTAEVTGDAQLAIAGNVTKGVYGGCNLRGVVKGDAIVGITGGTIGAAEPENRANIYGGGLGENTVVNGNVAVTVNSASGHIYGDVYGGSAKGVVNCTWDTDHYVHTDDDTTGVTFMAGTIHGDLYGGGHGLESQSADVYGPVTVAVGGGTVNDVFGGNNLKGAPLDAIVLNVTGGTVDSIFGGGNQAAYTAPLIPETSNRANYPEMNISGGTITHKVVGGGNAAGITGNPNVNISGGTICTIGDNKTGVYGGCNMSGTVDGNITLTITGSDDSQTTIGDPAIVLANETPFNVFGGGYGNGTSTTGNITVNYGDVTATDTLFPKLYGDLYGGSAFGTVNTNNTNNTTVNVLNGTIVSVTRTVGTDIYYYSGNIYGGGKGHPDHDTWGQVNGKVYVNIGSVTTPPSTGLNGKATLKDCTVFGCNNTNGSPQDDVEVHVYQTAHTTTDVANYYNSNRTYAIRQVFGGGNEAHFTPVGKKTYVYVHGCENTIEFNYGGGNAADATGVVTFIQGGRFSEIYGGGNGRSIPANIGMGGISLNVLGGNVGYLFEGSNKDGSNAGGIVQVPIPEGFEGCEGGLFVDSYFFGDNEAIHYGDLNNAIPCTGSETFQYRYVYAGSRWGVVYGDITLTVGGGIIENLFGGCKGYSDYSADVRKFPTKAAIEANPSAYAESLKTYLEAHPEDYGTGGNINLVINGGTIGDVFGGCDINGNVEGQIRVIVADAGTSCSLFVGNVHGGSNKVSYTPSDATVNSPKVSILKGNIGGSNAALPVNNTAHVAPTVYAGNVFGGGNLGNATSNPKVIVGDGTTGTTNTLVTIKGNVFGGGNEGDVMGATRVVLVPPRHQVSYSSSVTGGAVRVYDNTGQLVSTNTDIGEDLDLMVHAIPSVYGYKFSEWTVTGGSVLYNTEATTIFTMGTANATIEASFESVPTHPFTVTTPAHGTITVTDGLDVALTDDEIGEGAVLHVTATPDEGFVFKEWLVTQGDGTFNAPGKATTTFTMGTTNTIITAVFEAE